MIVDSLLGVISQVSKEPGVELLLDPIAASDNNTMLPCFQKLVIEENVPLCVHELVITVSHESVVRISARSLRSCEILEIGQELVCKQS
jgi:hypothetical protein